MYAWVHTLEGLCLYVCAHVCISVQKLYIALIELFGWMDGVSVYVSHSMWFNYIYFCMLFY